MRSRFAEALPLLLACLCCLNAYAAAQEHAAQVIGADAAAVYAEAAAAAAVYVVSEAAAVHLMVAGVAAADWSPFWAEKSCVTLIACQVNQCWAVAAVPCMGQIPQQAADW